MCAVLGIGVDLVEVSRIARSIERYGERFIRRILSESECGVADERQGHVKNTFVAGRFAAKEAVFKALGTGLGAASWSDVSVVNDALGKPTAFLAGVAKDRAAALGATRVHISISHTKDYAVAQAVIEGPTGEVE